MALLLNEYPYSDYQKINLDWVLDLCNKLKADAENGEFDGPRGYSVLGGENVTISRVVLGDVVLDYGVPLAYIPDAQIGDFVIGKYNNILSIMLITGIDDSQTVFYGNSVTSLQGPKGEDGDSSTLEQHTIVQSPPSVGSMLKVAESYFNQAYGENTHLVYDSAHGLFAPNVHSSVSGEETYPAIVCSQFSAALMKGITFEQSRYVLPNNHISSWGFVSDGTGSYVDFGEVVNDDASKDYMDAKHQLKYAIDHGWAYEISDIRKQIKPGDFIFYGLAGVSSWEDITHVALVLHVGLDDGYMINVESDDKTINGKRVGVVVKRFPIEKSGGHYLFGARFPVFDGASPNMVGTKILEDSNLSGTNTAYLVKQYDTPETMPVGFYTAVIDGTFNAGRVEVGIRYSDSAANVFDYSNGRVVRNAGRLAVTFYATKPFVQVRLGATANNAYVVNHWALYKGYYGQDWNITV